MTSPNEVPRLTDQQLVELALKGDQRAYGELVRRYEAKVFRENFQLVGDWDVADSATQETFARAFRALEGYESKRRFSAWLLRIAKNVALSRLEKRKLAMLPIEGSLLADTDKAVKYTALQISDRGESPLQGVMSQERDDQLRRAIARLRPAHREALLLHVEAVPHEEIARRMGIPINTVRTYISRARHKLKKTLGEEDRT